MATANNQPIQTTVGGIEYTIGTLNVFQSLSVTRMIAPVFPILFHELTGKIISVIQSGEGKTFEQQMAEISVLVSMSEPLFQVVAQMPEDQFQKVIRTCLSCVERKNGSSWARVMQNDTLMFQDMDQADILVLVIRVIAKHFRPFMKLLGASG